MKRSEINITVTLGDILHAPYINAWKDMCEKYGINEWCLNEGISQSNDTVEISLIDAEMYGLIELD